MTGIHGVIIPRSRLAMERMALTTAINLARRGKVDQAISQIEQVRDLIGRDVETETERSS